MHKKSEHSRYFTSDFSDPHYFPIKIPTVVESQFEKDG